MTITEALAEIKTIGKRLEKKKEFVMTYLGRVAMVKDPHEKSGGSEVLITKEKQAFSDLLDNVIRLRTAIQRKNLDSPVTICDVTRTLAEWIVWKREVYPAHKVLLDQMAANIAAMRKKAFDSNQVLRREGTEGGDRDILIMVNEKALADERERLEQIFGELDGQLSLKNAVLSID